MLRTPTRAAEAAIDITPDDNATIAPSIRAIYVGTSGDLRVQFEEDGSIVTLPNIVAGIIHPLFLRRVYSTGTTATDIVGLR